MDNRQLIERYPWLAKDFNGDTYEGYDHTALDEMPVGWRKAFGEEMQEELLEALEKTGNINTYYVGQIKEKFGELRWYDCGGNEETDFIVEKYSRLSANICIQCGRPDVPYTNGWIIPICEDCFNRAHGYLPEDQRHEAYLEVVKDSPSKMQMKAEFYRYEGNLKILDRTEDYTKTAQMIRDKYKKTL